jgi:hypothetical protein
MQASTLVTRESTARSIAYGNDVDRHVAAFRPYPEAGVGVVHVSQVGGRFDNSNTEGFFAFYRDQVLPRLRETAAPVAS